MNTSTNPLRLLSIGEFSAATQLTPKALRLYDEQRLMVPASTDPTNGYRYYRHDQVAVGRLVRTLRDMDLSLAQIAEVVSRRGGNSAATLRGFAQEMDRRYAREKRAFQTSLMLLHDASPSIAPGVDEFDRAELTVVVREFSADRSHFVEMFSSERFQLEALAVNAGVSPQAEAYCRLVDPLSDDESRLEVVLPIVISGEMPRGVTIRRIPATRCAAVTANSAAHASEFTAALDALFDWFDRHGHRAIEKPWLAFVTSDAGLVARIIWAFEALTLTK